ncbi:MAG: acyloxyacyl hydrolase [Alphaproteobacteria bacterium]|jgi:lipid A 3-O-deacylase
MSHKPGANTVGAKAKTHVIAAFFMAALFASTAWAGEPASKSAGDPEFLTFGAGMFDISANDNSAVISIEYTDDRRWLWALQPMTGIMASIDGSVHAYAGVAVDLFFGRRYVLTPSFAPGLYLQGDGKDLGHVVEFRSSLKFAYRFDNRSRLGLDLFHLSNAGLDDRNPGANQLMLTYSVPFNR